MNDKKCEWKVCNGVKDLIHFCDEMSKSMGAYEYRDNLARAIINGASLTCNFCGADIRKPESEVPIIKKSGETWVVRNGDIDYLCILTSNLTKKEIEDYFYIFSENLNSAFKPISEIEITDEIAKLRPMVVCEPQLYEPKIEKFIYLIPENVAHRHITIRNIGTDYIHSGWNRISLATVSDLED